MSKSSFSSSSSSGHSDAHNERLDEPNYILDYKAKNDFIKYFEKEEYLETCILNTKEKTGRKMQQKAIDNFYQEAIINVLPHHKISDIEKLFENLKTDLKVDPKTKAKIKTNAFKLQSVAVHRDEGVFIKSDLKVEDLYYDHNSKTWFDKEKNDVTSEVQVFRPGRNIFYNKENEKWYDNRKFENKIDTSTFQKYYNLHAHAVYTRYDFETGKNIRLSKNDMSKIQDITADTLQMERGKKKAKIENLEEFYNKVIAEMPKTETLEEYKKAFIYTSKKIVNRDYNRSSDHKHHNHLKDEAEISETKYNFREMQKQITSLEELSKEQKRELHKLNSKVKNDKATIEELNLTIAKLTATNHKLEIKEKKKELSLKEELKLEVRELRTELKQIKSDLGLEDELSKSTTNTNEKELSEAQEIKMLRSEIKALRREINISYETKKFLEFQKNHIEEQKKRINELESSKIDLEVQILEKDKKINSTPNLDDLRTHTEQELDIKFKKTPNIYQFFNYFIKNIKDLVSKIKELTTENTQIKEENTDLKIKITELEKDTFSGVDKILKEEYPNNELNPPSIETLYAEQKKSKKLKL